MKKAAFPVYIIIGTFALTLLASCADIHRDGDSIEYEKDQLRIISDINYLSAGQLRKFASMVEEAREDLQGLIPDTLSGDRQSFTFELLQGDDTSHTRNGVIRLYLAINLMSPYIREMARAMLGPHESTWFSEGLAVYFQSQLSQTPAPPLLGADAHAYAAYLILSSPGPAQSLAARIAVGETVDLLSFDNALSRNAYLNLSASFVTWLINELGLESVLKIYSDRTSLDPFFEHTGMAIGEYKTLWLNTIDSTEPLDPVEWEQNVTWYQLHHRL